jgi:hypothetical protein
VALFPPPILSDLTGRAAGFASDVGARGTTITACRINSCYVNWLSPLSR